MIGSSQSENFFSNSQVHVDSYCKFSLKNDKLSQAHVDFFLLLYLEMKVQVKYFMININLQAKLLISSQFRNEFKVFSIF